MTIRGIMMPVQKYLHSTDLPGVLLFLFLIAILIGNTAWAREKTEKSVANAHTVISSDKTKYHFGELVNLELKITNFSDGPLKIVRSSGLFNDLKFTVLLPNGKEAPLTLEGNRRGTTGSMVAARSVIDIKPKAECNYQIPAFNRLYDMTLEGEYTIKVQIAVLDTAHTSGWLVFSSNSIKVAMAENNE